VVVITDLIAEIKIWQAEGDSIILMKDLNGDVCNQQLRQPFKDIGLDEVLTMINGWDAPHTHQQGSKLIDRIFMSHYLISSCKGGYMAFGEGVPSNHQALWLDLLATWFYPLEIQSPVKFEA